MSKPSKKDELRPEYDLERLGRSQTGKYHPRAAAGTNLVLLDPDVAQAFPDSDAVNRALRLLMDVAAGNAPVAKRPTTRPSSSRPAALGTVAKRRKPAH